MGTWRVVISDHLEEVTEDIYRVGSRGCYDYDDDDWKQSITFGCVTWNGLLVMKQIMFRKKNIASILSLALGN